MYSPFGQPLSEIIGGAIFVGGVLLLLAYVAWDWDRRFS